MLIRLLLIGLLLIRLLLIGLLLIRLLLISLLLVSLLLIRLLLVRLLVSLLLISLLRIGLCLNLGLCRGFGLIRFHNFRFLRSQLNRGTAGGAELNVIAKNIAAVFTGIIHHYSSFHCFLQVKMPQLAIIQLTAAFITVKVIQPRKKS